MTTSESTPSFSIRQVLRKSFGILKSNFALFVALGLIYAIVGTLAERALALLNIFTTSNYMMVNVLIASWVIILLIYATAQIVDGKAPTLPEVLQGARGLYFNYLTVYLCMFLLIAVGFVFLILPGIYIAVVFAFADLLVVVERVRFMEAFSRSYDLVHTRFWKVFQFLAVIVLISLIPSVTSELVASGNEQLSQTLNKVFAVFVMPYYIIAQTVLYFEIKATIPPEQEPPIV